MKIFFLGTRKLKERKLINCKSEVLPFKLALINIFLGLSLFHINMEKNLERGSLKAQVTSVNKIMIKDEKNNLNQIFYADLYLNVNKENRVVKLNLDENDFNELNRMLDNDFEISYNVNYTKSEISDYFHFDINRESIKIEEKGILTSSNTYFETEIDIFSDNYNVIELDEENKNHPPKDENDPHMTSEEFNEKVYEDLIFRNYGIKNKG